ncbi:adenylyl cyclase [Mycobacterium tuberculosis]|uniref:Adenylyl cyclase n=1 Tax=Mycobacterium tuberculosis TaxID=1773 RepID=A0A654T773_MYCTX|nr:adenylyl cyclase [Mycobacterium tuberculosis]
MTDHVREADDANIDDLLGDLGGTARAERAKLVEWLLEQGITPDEIRATNPPLLLATRHLVGDDGTYVSAREISENYGVDLELLQRVQRAVGLARVDDPDAVVHMRADGEAAARAQRFVELGLNPDQVVLVVRVLAEGLSHAAEAMRYTALEAIMRPGATELDIAKGSQALVSQIVPLLGPMIQDMLFMQLRHMMETEAVNAGERAAGKPLPGARQVTVAFADLVGFTQLGEVVSAEELGHLAGRLAGLARDLTAPPVWFIKTIGDAVMLVCPDPAPLLDTVLKLVEVVDTDNNFPRLRAGVASGMAVSRAGEGPLKSVGFGGITKGLPHRIRDQHGTRARHPGHPACHVDRAAEPVAGPRRLRGIRGDVRLFRVRRGATRTGSGGAAQDDDLAGSSP